MDHFKNIRVPRELVFQFFVSFAKFEFALKTAGFSKGDEKNVSPDWDRYARSIKHSFDKTKDGDLEEAVDYFLVNPPWKQVLVAGAMAWDLSTPDNTFSEIEKILLLIRRVRNNLFHGGKFDVEVNNKRERTEKLLKYGLTVLEACLTINGDVRYNFENATI